MKIVKYILSCIIDCIDSLAGANTQGGIKETIVGLSSILFIVVLFFLSFILLDRKTNLKHEVNILYSILISTLFIATISILLILFEKLF